jgi:hypothetical protein
VPCPTPGWFTSQGLRLYRSLPDFLNKQYRGFIAEEDIL